MSSLDGSLSMCKVSVCMYICSICAGVSGWCIYVYACMYVRTALCSLQQSAKFGWKLEYVQGERMYVYMQHMCVNLRLMYTCVCRYDIMLLATECQVCMEGVQGKRMYVYMQHMCVNLMLMYICVYRYDIMFLATQCQVCMEGVQGKRMYLHACMHIHSHTYIHTCAR
jgi:hypothetical protein